jgi:hypothetical protein
MALVLAATLLAVSPALAASAGTAASLHVSPNPVAPGASVRLTGSVGLHRGRPQCPAGDQVDLLSEAFAPHRNRALDFAGVPTVLATVRRNGTFAATGRIRQTKHAGTYTIGGRCGGGNLGFHVRLRVR